MVQQIPKRFQRFPARENDSTQHERNKAFGNCHLGATFTLAAAKGHFGRFFSAASRRASSRSTPWQITSARFSLPCKTASSRFPIHPGSQTVVRMRPRGGIQVGGKQYTKVAGLTWVETTKPDSFADITVGPTELQSKDKPTPLPPKVRTAAPRTRQPGVATARAQQFDPVGAFIGLVTAPIRFADW
jgi:hypothetical protein